MNPYVILRSIVVGGAVGTAFGIFIAPDNLTHALVFGNIGTWTGAIAAGLAALCLPGPKSALKKVGIIVIDGEPNTTSASTETEKED